jgi:hypothetical protein
MSTNGIELIPGHELVDDLFMPPHKLSVNGWLPTNSNSQRVTPALAPKKQL